MPRNNKYFHENIELWSRANPKAAVFLPYLDSHDIVLCKTSEGQDNLKKKINGKFHHFYSNVDAVKESEKWFSSLHLSDVEVLYVYGVGLGYYYDAAKEWLHADPKRNLIFVEDDLAVIRVLFDTERASRMLHDPQVHLSYFEDVEDPNSPLSELYWIGMTLKMHISALHHYAKEKKEIFKELNHKLVFEATLHETMVEEYLDYGIPFFQNFYPNMLLMAGTYLGNKMTDKFRGVPAIICGAGPSLNNHLSLLGEVGDRALIFAGGSALNALNSAGLQPHFGAGIDPNPMQFERLSSNSGFEVPFFFRNRMNNRAFQMIHGPRLYIAGSGGYDVSEWFESKFDIASQTIDEGFNVVNFCLEIARIMGCNPIIMVGMDLAFTGMESYAAGVEGDISVTEEKLLTGKDLDDIAIVKNDIHGKPVYTLWKWVAEAHWISSFARAVADSIQIINSTEGGIGMEDVPNMTLKSAMETHLSQEYDLINRIHGEIQNSAMPQITHSKIVEAMTELRDSLLRCCEHLDVLVNDATNVIETIKREKNRPAALQGGRAVLSEIELAEEPGYLHVLAVFNQVYSKVLAHEMHQMQASADPEWKKAITRLMINNKKLSFLHDVAKVNVEGINRALSNKR